MRVPVEIDDMPDCQGPFVGVSLFKERIDDEMVLPVVERREKGSGIRSPFSEPVLYPYRSEFLPYPFPVGKPELRAVCREDPEASPRLVSRFVLVGIVKPVYDDFFIEFPEGRMGQLVPRKGKRGISRYLYCLSS